ncbi:uncharacterized protein Bfra_009342 [Botrytis fragariae]|uniref:Uncharacterized protein n=1 Tax=Botrytis fragariae TaxID=1964551 RepID=A0A8H6ANQ0_9HELO|nr:uncharacterized protein Bfra_009342 [Botrytis fragariae]KAF5870789.1 hypothetical protein Bfra_009342 [Botrytis fragariae]
MDVAGELEQEEKHLSGFQVATIRRGLGRKDVTEFRRAISGAVSHPKVEIEAWIAEGGGNRTTHSGKRIGQGSKSIELEGLKPR